MLFAVKWISSKPNGPNTINLVEKWAQEVGFSESYNNRTWSYGGWMIKHMGEGRKFILGLDLRTDSSSWFFSASLRKLSAVVRTAIVFLLSLSSLLPLFPFLEGLLCYMPPFHWSWPSICWSCRFLLECLSHLLPSSTCSELQQTKRYYSGVISSLMRPDCQLRAFNAEVTTSPRIAPLPCPHSWPTVLVLLFRTPGEATFKGVSLSPYVTLVRQGQGCPRRCLLAAWTFLVHPWMFLLPRRGP